MFGKYIKNNKAFAIYDEIAKTLTFHKNSSIPNVGDIYAYTDDNGKLVKKQVTKVYKNIENLVCKYYWVVPWKHYREKIVYVEVVGEDSHTNSGFAAIGVGVFTMKETGDLFKNNIFLLKQDERLKRHYKKQQKCHINIFKMHITSFTEKNKSKLMN